MADIFVSYARPDQPLVQRMAGRLKEAGFSVFADWSLEIGGGWRTELQEQIDRARKVLVVWTARSIASRFVHDEVDEAIKQKKLVPIIVDGCEPPLGFRSLHGLKISSSSVDSAPLAGLFGKPGPSEKPSSRPKIAVQRVALVVGNSTYGPRTLSNCRRDADRVASTLSDLGFRIIKRHDTTKSQLEEAILLFQVMLREFGGVGIFYFAGHAGHSLGEDYLVPSDSPGGMGAQKRKNIVNMSSLLKPVDSFLDEHPSSVGNVIMYSTSPGQFASDGPDGGHSPFNEALRQAISQGNLELSQLLQFVKTQTQANAGQLKHEQIPTFVSDSLFMDFHINDGTTDRPGVLKIILIDACRNEPYGWTERLKSRLFRY